MANDRVICCAFFLGHRQPAMADSPLWDIFHEWRLNEDRRIRTPNPASAPGSFLITRLMDVITIPPRVTENPACRHAGSDSTTTKSTTAKRCTKSRNSDMAPRAVSVFRFVANNFLRGWQYDNLLLAYTAAPSRTASDAPEVRCTHLRVCQVVPEYANSVSRAKYYAILGRGAVIEV
jgi:hypothetical protein